MKPVENVLKVNAFPGTEKLEAIVQIDEDIQVKCDEALESDIS